MTIRLETHRSADHEEVKLGGATIGTEEEDDVRGR
jgi:hypothetical protein